MDRGNRQGLRQCSLQLKCVTIHHLFTPLSHIDGVVCRTELLLALERCDKISCDNTGQRPVIGGHLFRVWEGQTRLFHWQAVDPPPQGSLYYTL